VVKCRVELGVMRLLIWPIPTLFSWPWWGMMKRRKEGKRGVMNQLNSQVSSQVSYYHQHQHHSNNHPHHLKASHPIV